MLVLTDITLVLFQPAKAFQKIARDKPKSNQVFLGYALWLGLIPPFSAYIGTSQYGWHFGIGDPVQLETSTNILISVLYYIFLLIGFGIASVLTKWMAPTYGGDNHGGICAAFIAIVGTPLMLGGALHLYPLLPLNFLFLVPAIIWSVYLLYTGLPLALGTHPTRGMLMASSLLAVFFIAVLALGGATMVLWTLGIGPDLGFDWRSSVGGG